MEIKELLKGNNKESQARLDEIFHLVGDNPRILWYPSAGNDYRDILELSNIKKPENIRGSINIATDYGITDLPDLFIHTDYSTEHVKLKTGEVFNDGRTVVTIEYLYKLKFRDGLNIDYYVNPDFVVSTKDAPKSPKIYLLDVKIKSDKLGEFKKPVFYFMFENINFLQEVLLKNRINISHIVKIREGCGKGDNKKSISVAYAFLSVLNTKYLIIDNEANFDFDLFNRIAKNLNLELKDYELEELKSKRPPIRWSDRDVNIFKVIIREGRLTSERMKEILKPMEQKGKI
jgi:hypothetical protein